MPLLNRVFAAAIVALLCAQPPARAIAADAASIPPDLAWVDALLSAGGPPPEPATADPDWRVAPPADTGAEPRYDYPLLRTGLDGLMGVARAGGWPAIAAGAPLGPGVRDPRVEILRTRLQASGDYDSEMGADPWFFDSGMDTAVRRFQERHELPPDGIVGERTLEALNVPLEARIAQLAVTMARWRWLPRDLGASYVWVNIPRAQLDVYVDGRSVLEMPVVVGHRVRPTPSLSGRINRVVFNPTWTVPRTIAVEDLLPQQRDDPQFLHRHRIRVYEGSAEDAREVSAAHVDWKRLGPDRFPYRLVQDAGPGNSLGRIKLAFDNPFDIFLHDTPAKGMFGLNTRSLSSGCVRLADAPALTALLLAAERPWTDADTAAHIEAPRTETIRLERGLPVYLVYLTAWADPDGSIHYGRDIYGRDERVLAAVRPPQ